MKNTYLLYLLLLIGLTAKAQEKTDGGEHSKLKVPEAVSQAFQKDFPSVKNEHWSAEGMDYESEFRLNGSEATANYNNSGHRTELETIIMNTDLPSAAMNYIRKNYADYRIKESAKVTDDKNAVTFEVQVQRGREALELVFDKDGNFMEAGGGEID